MKGVSKEFQELSISELIKKKNWEQIIPYTDRLNLTKIFIPNLNNMEHYFFIVKQTDEPDVWVSCQTISIAWFC